MYSNAYTLASVRQISEHQQPNKLGNFSQVLAFISSIMEKPLKKYLLNKTRTAKTALNIVIGLMILISPLTALSAELNSLNGSNCGTANCRCGIDFPDNYNYSFSRTCHCKVAEDPVMPPPEQALTERPANRNHELLQVESVDYDLTNEFDFNYHKLSNLFSPQYKLPPIYLTNNSFLN